jgi:hypothetical protein
MVATNTTLPLPSVSQEVQAFAAEQGVTPYLPAVLELARRLFPAAPMTVLKEGDPEIANDWHIVIEVDTAGMTAEQLITLHRQWSRELFQRCPATHVCVFRLGMV